MKVILISVVVFAGIAISSTFTDAAEQAAKKQAATATQDQSQVPNDLPARSQRSKSLQFDDSVVEGLNQNSKDSLEMVDRKDGRNRQHLYQKRADFKPEIKQFPSEMGYSP